MEVKDVEPSKGIQRANLVALALSGMKVLKLKASHLEAQFCQDNLCAVVNLKVTQ
jgi:hypothetical protein